MKINTKNTKTFLWVAQLFANFRFSLDVLEPNPGKTRDDCIVTDVLGGNEVTGCESANWQEGIQKLFLSGN
jgi:hypothetical protein